MPTRSRQQALAVLYESARRQVELSASSALTDAGSACTKGWTAMLSLLCGRLGFQASIPGRFSSSSLPPSFVPGRRTAGFIRRDVAARDIPAFLQGGAT